MPLRSPDGRSATCTRPANSHCSTVRRAAVAAARLFGAAVVIGSPMAVTSAAATEIRLHASNRVPACVTPERLMAFLATRNGSPEQRFRDIAHAYKQHGEAWRVRWDYAFFQMAVETNYLTFRRGDGSFGDVKSRQNNFAGLGTTGGGVPGDSYPSVSTGVLAQIQHLVAYSGERMPAPVGPRTRLKQDDIVAVSLQLGRPVRFADLARRWAVDPNYGRTIEGVARQYREQFCRGAEAAGEPGSAPTAASQALDGRRSLGGEPALVRQPAPAERHPAIADHARPALRTAGSVRTVWRQQSPGETPPDSGTVQRALAPRSDAVATAVPVPVPLPVPATRSVAAVAAATAERPPTATVTPAAPVTPSATAAEPGLAGAAPATALKPASQGAADAAPASPPIVQGPIIKLAAAAAPFAAGSVVSHSTSPYGDCRITVASFDGTRSALIKAVRGPHTELVVLAVVPGLEAATAASYIRTRAPGGSVDGTFESREAALARAREICPPAN